MKLGRTLALASVVLGMTALASPGCGSSGVVGGGCADGYTNCSNQCVDLQTDQYNCGRCGHACVSGVACIRGKCGGVDESGGAGYGGAGGDFGHYRDGSTDAGSTSSDATGDHINEFDVNYPQGGSTSNGGASSGGNTASSAGNGGASPGGDTSAGGSSSAPDANPCNPPYSDPLHCGDCITVCPSDNPVCAPTAGSYKCRPMCDAPLVDCNGTCADLNSDSNNCGQCGHVCPSGVCQAGACVGVRPGNFVGICMNYRTATNAQTLRILGNSISLASSSPIRILVYDEYADTSARQQVDATLGALTGQTGPLTITHVSNSADVPSVLRASDYDVFLVDEQPNAPTGELSRIGDLWASALESFTYVGGVIVMLDGGQGVHEMPQLFTSTRMFQVNSEVVLTPPPLLVDALPGDFVGAHLFTPLPSQADTCVFDTSTTPNANTSFVITESTDAGAARPVVVHISGLVP